MGPSCRLTLLLFQGMDSFLAQGLGGSATWRAGQALERSRVVTIAALMSRGHGLECAGIRVHVARACRKDPMLESAPAPHVYVSSPKGRWTAGGELNDGKRSGMLLAPYNPKSLQSPVPGYFLTSRRAPLEERCAACRGGTINKVRFALPVRRENRGRRN